MHFVKLTSILILCSLAAQAQFVTIGDARPMDNGCILLTPDEPYSEGIAYSTTLLNLNFDFEISFDIYLGDKDDNGADGITFVIHKDRRNFQAYGTYGECLGYGRWNPYVDFGTYIAPSVAIEFDTYYNLRQNDPLSDHIAYLENGVSFHRNYWNDNNENFNMEDGSLHQFRFIWNSTLQTIQVFFDNKLAFQGQRDLINDIFNGENMVIWGFTASTGRKYNLQYFCLRRLAINYNPTLEHPLEVFKQSKE
ncbi:MAG: L-type lectin-domain containing protein [Cyclobacteriaceae bacterium]